jgi:hypothetical protein
MRHPFAGIIVPQEQSVEPQSQQKTRRSLLKLLVGAIAGFFGLSARARAQQQQPSKNILSLALGEAGSNVLTRAFKEEAGDPTKDPTKVRGEEGVSTTAKGEEGGVTTKELNEEGATKRLGEDGGGKATTLAIGEEGATTRRVGEEGGATTKALNEEGATTNALGEEGATTNAIGEEGGGPPRLTQALNEAGGKVRLTEALNEDGQN